MNRGEPRSNFSENQGMEELEQKNVNSREVEEFKEEGGEILGFGGKIISDSGTRPSAEVEELSKHLVEFSLEVKGRRATGW